MADAAGSDPQDDQRAGREVEARRPRPHPAGRVADVVLFNAKTIVDRSTFTEPAVLPAGMEKVFVGGELVWDGGKPTAARPGRVLMSGHTPANADAGPYQVVDRWARLPSGVRFGEVPGMTIDAAGRVFAFTRAEPPVIEFDASGRVLKTWGANMFVWPIWRTSMGSGNSTFSTPPSAAKNRSSFSMTHSGGITRLTVQACIASAAPRSMVGSGTRTILNFGSAHESSGKRSR